MDAQKLRAALRETPLAGEFSESMIERLASHASWKHCSTGTILFREGESHSGFYIVHQGHVALEMCFAGRGCTRLLTLGKGEIVAWSSLVGDGRMTATAIAQDHVELIELSGPELMRLCEADKELGYLLMRRLAAALSKRLLATRLQLLDLYATEALGEQGRAR